MSKVEQSAGDPGARGCSSTQQDQAAVLAEAASTLYSVRALLLDAIGNDSTSQAEAALVAVCRLGWLCDLAAARSGHAPVNGTDAAAWLCAGELQAAVTRLQGGAQ